MKKFARACFCCSVLRMFYPTDLPSVYSWLLLFHRAKPNSLLTIGDDARQWWAVWANSANLAPVDFDRVIKMLVGDEHFTKNKQDIVKLEREAGQAVIDLWDTDPIFAKYPHLRGLARNLEFEKIWEKLKQKQK